MTDFGLKDQYVFQMKSVIKQISPDSEIIDITHEIPKFDIHVGSFILVQASKYLPKSSVVIGVVDPGVGSSRRCIAIKTNDHYFIGPDNGLLFEAVSRQGEFTVREITSNEVVLKRGGTFDGRDVFAPTAAHILEGYPFVKIGPEISDLVVYKFSKPRISKRTLVTHVLHLDDFGNAVLDLTADEFHAWSGGRDRFSAKIGSRSFKVNAASSYTEIKDNGLIAGSSGYMELSTNRRGPISGALQKGTPILLGFSA